MPWSGGAFTRTNGVHTGATLWAQDRDAGTKILATRHDTHDQDLADGINSTLEKSGSNAATGNLNIGSNRLTAVADGTAKTDAATVNQIQSNAPAFQATDTGTANAYVVALSPAVTAYAAGQAFTFKAGAASTTASTLNVNGLGTKAIKKLHDQDIASGDIESGSIVTVVYDGTNFQMTSQLATTASSGAPSASTSAKTSAYTVVAGDDASTVLCSAASADYEVALTAAATLGDGFTVTIKKSDATRFMITINPNSTETIDGLPDLKLRNEHSEVTLICDGSNWHIISHENVAYEYNAIDNSNFQVDQYSQSVTRTALGSGSSLTVQDRWKIAMSGSPSARFTYSVETGGGVDGRQKWAKLLCTTANASPDSNDQLMIRHNITGNNLVGAGFLGTDKFVENMIISFDIIVHLDGGSSESFPVKMGVNCFTGDSTSREYVNDVSVAAADTWERVSIVIPQDTAANWSAGTSATLYFNWNLTAGSGSVGTANTWANTSYTDYITSASSNFADATNNYVGITNVKLQPGQIATPYIPRTYEEELTVCKFYAELLNYQTAGSQVVAFGTASSTSAGQVSVTYQEKRAAPAVTGSAAGTFQLSDYNGGGTNDATGVSWNEPGLTNVRMSVSYGGTAFTVNDAIRVNRDGSDAAFIFINAEV